MGVSVPRDGPGDPARTRERVRVRVERRRPRHRRRPLRRALVVTALLALAGALDAVWVATTVERALRDARTHMQRGAAALAEGRVEEARSSFVLARSRARLMLGALDHPAGLVAGLLPGLSEDVDALRALGEATDHGARAGQELVRAAEATAWNGVSTDVLRPGGGIRVDLVAEAADPLRSAAVSLSRAQRVLAPTAGMDLLGPISRALAEARGELAASSRLVGSAADLARLLPPMLGSEGPSRYLLALQNLSDPRGSGGFFGLYGVIEARDGRLGLSAVRHTGDVRAPAPADAPPGFPAPYSALGSLRYLHATTAPPDFPTAARLAMAVWGSAGREPVDGVIAADPVALAYLIGVTGPVETPSWPEPLTSDNVATVVEHDSFLLPQPASDRTQEEIARAAWASVLRGNPSPLDLASALSRATRERHLQVFSRDPEQEALLDRLGASGRVEVGDDGLLVVWQGASANRAGYFARRRIEYHASLHADGSAEVVLRATLRNTAPRHGPPSILFGDQGTGEPRGQFSAYVSVFLPDGARVLRPLRVEGAAPTVCLGPCGHGPVLTALVRAPPRTSATLEVAYGLPAPSPGQAGRFHLRLLPQPALRPALYSVEIALPPGSRILATSPSVVGEGSSVRWRGSPTQPQDIGVDYVPARN